MTSILFKSFVGFLIVTLVFYLSPVPLAYANPVGGSVSSGVATITNSGNTETIRQTTGKAVIDWNIFNINSGETTNFVQPNSSSLTVNRVHDMNPSQIFGSLTANGNLVLINPNGVFFGQGSKVDVNGLLATTSNVANSNVMSGGTLHFTPGSNPNASVVNAGTITAADAGLVGLVAPNVQNSGVITARLGKVQLSSGDSFDLDFYGDNLLKIGVSDQVGQQMVQNLGLIEADGGTVKLTAAAGRSIVNSLIDVEGQIKTPAFKQQDGVIEIYAAGSNAVQGNIAADKGIKQGTSKVTVSGLLDASGKDAGQSGGKIEILGDDIAILSGSYLDASGVLTGGNIKVGGDFHGLGATPTASATVVQNNATINASSLDNDNGGTVAVWSDNYTNFAGSILARGGPNGGNGGFVETSGHQTLNMQGIVDASASKGKGGTWLMDPEDVNITNSDSDDTGSDGAASFGPGGNQATASVNAQYIVDALNAGTNVTVTTTNSGAAGSQSGPNGGSITVSSPISATGQGTALTTTGSLTLSSFKNIIVNAAITLGGGTNTSSATVTGGTLTLDADNQANGSGYIDIEANITTNGGNITMGGGEANPANIVAGTGYAWGNNNNSSRWPGVGVAIGNNNDVTVNAGGGNIIINGNGNNYTGSGGPFDSLFGVLVGYVTTGSTLETGNGNIIINGIAGDGPEDDNYGIANYGTIKSTGTGNISMTGYGGNYAGGSSSAFDQLGIYNANTIESLGTGNVTLIGYGGKGVDGNYGLQTAAPSPPPPAHSMSKAMAVLTHQRPGFRTIMVYLLVASSPPPVPAVAVPSPSSAPAQRAIAIMMASGSSAPSAPLPRRLPSPALAERAHPPAIMVRISKGENITSTGNGTITINGTGGNGGVPIYLSGNVNVTADNTAITFNNAAQMDGNSTINAGTGTVTFAGTVDDSVANTSNLTVTGGTVNLEGAIGGTTPLNAVSITAANALTLPAISAASVTAVTTGATADIALDGEITASGTGNAIVIASGRNFDNTVGSGVFDLTGGGRWIVYSTTLAGDTNGASQLNPIQTINGQTYVSEAPASISGASNTWVYSSSGTPPAGGNPGNGGGGSGNGGGGNVTIPPIVIPPAVVAPAPTPAITPTAPVISNNVVPTEQEVSNIPVIWNSEPVPNDNPGGLRFVNQPSFAPSEVAFQVPEINAPVETPAASNNGTVQQSPDPGDAKPDQKKPEDKKDKSRQSRLRELRDRIMRAGRLGRLRLGGADEPELQPAS